MANTIPDISVSTSEFVSVNTLTGILIGTAVTLQNKGQSDIYFVESDVKPADNSTDGLIITTINRPFSIGNSTAGSNELWVRADGSLGKLHVQEDL